MPLTKVTIMGLLPHERRDASAGAEIAAWLRAHHPHHTAKMVAADLSAVGLGECSIRTAENILQGHLSAKSITRLSLAYGLALLIDTGARVTGQTLESFIETQAERARNEQGRWDRLSAVLANGRAARAAERASLVGKPPEHGRLPVRRSPGRDR